MEKLPVLFVSCNASNLELHARASSGPARVLWGKQYQSILIISSDTRTDVQEIADLEGNGNCAEIIRSLLEREGFSFCNNRTDCSSRITLLRALLNEEPNDLAELRLHPGSREKTYWQVAKCLEVMREQGVLVICLNDKSEQGIVTLHDRRLREVLYGWVQNQQWDSVVKFKGDEMRLSSSARLNDPTICVLKAAFSLGGCRFPQRLFSSGMNGANEYIFGFGWMR